MFKDFIIGLELIRDKYLIHDRKGDLCAEHDVIYIWDVDLHRMTEFDIRELVKLGFIPGMFEDLDVEEVLLNHNLLGEDENFNWENVTNEQWNLLREELPSCVTYLC